MKTTLSCIRVWFVSFLIARMDSYDIACAYHLLGRLPEEKQTVDIRYARYKMAKILIKRKDVDIDFYVI